MLPRSIIAASVLMWSLVALMLLAQPAAAERRVALVLGNSAYRAAGLELVNPKYDAEDVAAALTGLGFEVLLEIDSPKAVTDHIVEEFARKAAGADTALFFYAGHALQYQGRNFLLPIDADVTDEASLETATVPIEAIRKQLERSNGVKIMVLDASRNNPVAERLAQQPAPTVPALAAKGGLTRGIERIDQARGLIVAYATAPGDVALDGQGRNSLFTTAFLRRLGEPGLEVELMFRRIAADVDAATNGRQRPETYISMASEYFLNRNDRIEWEKVKSSNDIAELRDFLEHFPSSYYALEAQYKLQALERAISNERQRRAEEIAQKGALVGDEARRTCEADRAKLAAIAPRDEPALHSLFAKASCAEVKRDAAARLDAAEAARAREAELCAHEEAEFQERLPKATHPEISALRRRANCPGTLALVDRKVAKLATLLDAACGSENVALGKIGARDADGLRKFVAAAACEDVKTKARQRLAKLESDVAAETEICRRDDEAWTAIAQSGNRAEAEALRARIRCPAVLAKIDTRLAELKIVCRRDDATLGKIGARDADGLRKFVAAVACDDVKTKARQRLAKLESDVAAETEICRRDDAALGKIGARDADGLRKFVAATVCDDVKSKARQRLAKLESDVAAETEICRRDDAALAKISARDADGLRKFIAVVACDDVKTKARQRLAKLESDVAAETEICRRDDATLGKIGARDADGLRKFVAATVCDDVKSKARQRLAKLESDVAAETEICRRDDAALAKISARDADGLRKFVAATVCDDVKTKARQRLAKLESDVAAETALLNSPSPPKPQEVNSTAQIRGAQTELRRLGCFEGGLNGKLDAGTQNGVTRYFEATGRATGSIAEIEITDGLLIELKGQGKKVCAPPVVATPEPEPTKPVLKKKPVAALPPKDEPRERPVGTRPPQVKPQRPAVAQDRQRPATVATPARPQRPLAVGGGSSATGGARPSPTITGVGF